MDASTLRSFNRSYSRRVGVLSDSYLDTGRPLGPSRLLFEIGRRVEGVTVLELRTTLGLDSGYVSRLLRQLEGEQLIEVAPDPADRRQRRVRLTERGSVEWARLDERSEAFARRILEPLTPSQRAELDAALATAERLLRTATVTFDVVDPASPDAQHAMTSYFAELDARFPTGFEPGDALHVDALAMRPPQGAFVVVRSDMEAIGCGGLQRIDDETSEIKRMWIHPQWRGLALGSRLLRHLEQLARELGRRRVVLDTNGSLREAISMYESTGYARIQRYNDNPYAQHWFEKDLGPSALS